MTTADGPFANVWLMLALALAAILVIAVLATIGVFAMRRRASRRTISLLGHPAGTAVGQPGEPPTQYSPRPSTSSLPSAPPSAPPSSPVRFRRREAPPIREAEPTDDARLAEIDAQTGHGVSHSGLGALPSPGLRGGPARASVVLVAGRPALGYVRIDELDGLAHLDRLCVLPSATRRGVGTALLQAAIDWAAAHDYRAMTLSTFADVEWNAPVYGAVGFHPITELSPGLVELRDWERALGLDAVGRRVVMRREL